MSGIKILRGEFKEKLDLLLAYSQHWCWQHDVRWLRDYNRALTFLSAADLWFLRSVGAQA